MASTASLEASEIRRRGRRRLIGAIALVMLLVVFVPMLLDSEPRPERQAPAFEIPPRDNAPALPPPTRALPAAAKPAGAPKIDAASAAPQASSPAPAAVKPVETQAAGKPAAEKPAETGAADKAEPKAAAPRLEGFVVQVGAFRDEARLRQAREKLAAAGVVHYTERLETSAGPLTRLRAGPFPTREAAEAAQAKLKRAAVEGKVVPLQ